MDDRTTSEFEAYEAPDLTVLGSLNELTELINCSINPDLCADDLPSAGG